MSHAPALAALASDLQRRLSGWVADLHPAWLPELGLPPELVRLAREEGGPRLNTQLFVHCCGPLPPLDRVAVDAGPLALLPAQALRARLCALALMARPGTLRHCVQRQARVALQTCLGPAYGRLRACTDIGTPAQPMHPPWEPEAWAWVGYQDLLAAGAWPHPSLQRLVRLVLPASEAGLPAAEQVPPPPGPARARLQRLEALFGTAAPC